MDGATSPGQPGELPERRVSLSQLVSYNMAFFRRAAGMTQAQLGEPFGWSVASVSAAERAWDSQRIRKFDADEIVKIAWVLGIPVIALLLPPQDADTAVRYRFDFGADRPVDVLDLMPRVVPEYRGDTPAMAAFRQRLLALGTSSATDPALASEEAGQILLRAQTDADAILAAARNQQDWIIADARAHAEALLQDLETAERPDEPDEAVAGGIADARKAATEVLERARRDAGAILTRARLQSEQITHDARLRAESLEKDAQRRHQEAMGSLPERREQLERRVSDLSAFEREYRVRLIKYHDLALRELLAGAEDPDSLPPVGTPPAENGSPEDGDQ
jgi:cell division septum initiation protein DivIVA